MDGKQIKIQYLHELGTLLCDGARLPEVPALINFFHGAPIRWRLGPVQEAFFELARAIHIEEYLRQKGRRVVGAYTYNGSVRLVIE